LGHKKRGNKRNDGHYQKVGDMKGGREGREIKLGEKIRLLEALYYSNNELTP